MGRPQHAGPTYLPWFHKLPGYPINTQNMFIGRYLESLNSTKSLDTKIGMSEQKNKYRRDNLSFLKIFIFKQQNLIPVFKRWLQRR